MKAPNWGQSIYLFIAAWLCSASPATFAAGFETEAEEMMYFWGTQMAAQLEAAAVATPENLAFVQRGMNDKLADNAPEFGQEYPSLLNNFLVAEKNRSIELEKQLSAEYLEDFISENKGAETTDSGLVFVELNEGSGRQPLKSSKIRAHYTGKLRDGTIFDSSVEAGAPLTIRLTQTIACWREGILKMKSGGKAILVCPANIAYGDKGWSNIPGGAALTFEIELLEIVEG